MRFGYKAESKAFAASQRGKRLNMTHLLKERNIKSLCLVWPDSTKTDKLPMRQK